MGNIALQMIEGLLLLPNGIFGARRNRILFADEVTAGPANRRSGI